MLIGTHPTIAWKTLLPREAVEKFERDEKATEEFGLALECSA